MQKDMQLPFDQNTSNIDLDRVIKQLNNTKVNYPGDVNLIKLFESQVVQGPYRDAVIYEGSSLTYSELNQRANQLAHHLQTLGVGPDVLVGVYMERSLEMVVALYGILKAGGAYVPVDPEYPRERVIFMLEDTQVPVLLTHAHLLAKLPKNEAKVICLDTDWISISGAPISNPINQISPENLAYVIFTSGSTGKPKGAMNTHRGICNRLLWMQDTFKITEEDRVMQKTSFSFDVSVWEFFWPLLFGASLVVAKPGGHRDPDYIVDQIIQHGITTIHFVPSMLQLFLDAKGVSHCRSLKRVIVSGETLSYELQERFFNKLDANLYNLYGPTEAAVDVTYWICEKGSSLGFVPIGRPVANTQIYLLDVEMKPVPIGEPGELHIGGVQVARGYLNRPELTASKFVPDPFSSEPGAMLYKTGDLACYLPTGDLKFLGRADNQVKIGGNRIELGEIEAVLEVHPSVKQAVVLAREDTPGEKRLVAYVVSNPQAKHEVEALRGYLGEKLPEYMLPSAFIFLDAMPLTPTGKVDRLALPKSSKKRPELEQAYVAPRDEVERYLTNLWCEILGLESIGIYDRFFESGGTSLQAVRFINRLQQELSENIYIVSFFETTTIAAYAAYLKKNFRQAIANRLNLQQAVGDAPQKYEMPNSGGIPSPLQSDEAKQSEAKSRRALVEQRRQRRQQLHKEQ
jgi:amino acid adenylation domain-containing protein